MLGSISVIILTFNEQNHIARCIKSIKSIATEIVVIDSFSTDSTLEIARSYGANVYQHEFSNQSNQLNWALQNCPIKSRWIFRLDADEVATSQLRRSLVKELASLPDMVSGITVNRQIYFLGKWIRYGGMYPVSVLRIWRKNRGHCENRLMDEHIIVNGKIQHVSGDIIDNNLNNLTWWIDKHNNYASREAIEMLKIKKENESTTPYTPTRGDKQAFVKRWIKDNAYSRLPLGLRAFIYFLYRYFIRLGFLDGWQGLSFHVLQGFWYRFLVDLKLYELEQMIKKRKHTTEEIINSELGYKAGEK